MLSDFKKRLSSRDRAYFKLAIWAALITWVVSLIIITLVIAPAIDKLGETLVSGMLGHIVGFIWATAFVMAVFFSIYEMLRWANRKLRGNNNKNENQ